MNQKILKQKGITLIALVITVILLLILAGVTITIAINTGVMNKSEKTVETWKVEDYKERIELAKTEEFLNKSTDRLPEKLKTLVVRNLEGEKNENWVKRVRTDETGNAELAEDEIEVLTTDGYIIIAKIDEKNGEITWRTVIKDNGEPYPTLTLNQKALEGTKNEKVKVEVKAEVEETKKTKNIAKIEVIQNGKVIETRNYETLEVTDIFEIELKGEYIFKATTNQDQSTSKKLITNIEGTENKIEITAEPTTPRNTIKTEIQNGIATGPIKFKMEYGETNLKKIYRIDEGDWEEVTGTSKELKIKKNCVIVAKYYDGINSFNAETYNIQNVDNVAPNKFDITETHTTNSITVTANKTGDTASEGAATGIEGVERYEYRINSGSWQTSNVFSNLITGTYTVQAKAIDKAGNETISTNTLSIPLDTVSVEDVTISATPTTARNTVKTTTQNGVATGPISVEISYGNTNYTREYKIGSGTWQTVTGNTANFTVTENTTIVARYYDGTNGFETETYNIQNVDNVAPNKFDITETHTTNSITVTANNTGDTASSGAATGIADILRYEYRTDNGSWQESNEFTGLISGTHTVQAKAIDKAGNETISTNTLSIPLDTVPVEDVKISATPTTARNTGASGTQNGVAKGPISVTITYGNSNYTRQYKIGTGDWQTVTGTATFTVTTNTTIVARYYDGTNGFETTAYNIKNVDNVAPNAFSITETHTTNSITVTANNTGDTASSGAADGIAGIKRYEYRIDEGSWGTSNVFSGVTTGSHTVQAKAIDNAGNETISTNTLNVTMTTIPVDDVKISANPTTARNTGTSGTQNGVAKGPISVTITYGNSNYTRQYKIGSGTWQTVTGTASFTVTENTTIVARYYDGTNGFETTAYNIKNVDNVAPNAFSITETHTTNSITVTASTTDTASSGAAEGIAGILRYEYRIDGGDWQTSKTFTGVQTGTHTVQAKAIDNAGNETISTNTLNVTMTEIPVDKVTITANPTTARNTGTSGTQNGVAKGPISVTITYDNTSYTRQYKIGTGNWQTVTGTSASFTVTENIAIVARYYDGTNGFETETYNIQNVDNIAPTITNAKATVSGATITASATFEDTASEGGADGIAGVKTKQYKLGDGSWQDSNEFTVSTPGGYTVYIKAIDNAGNETTVNTTATVEGYTVSLVKGTGISTVTVGTSSVIKGQSTTISATLNNGSGSGKDNLNGSKNRTITGEYKFDEWTITSGTGIISSSSSASTTVKPTSNITIQAVASKDAFAYNNPVIPVGFKALDTTDAKWTDTDNDGAIDGWDNGLVIQDNDGNEFVWVPVDGTNVTYAKWCTAGCSYSDTSDDSLPSGVSNESTQINTYHGFYIARYGAGIPSTLSTAQTTATADARNVSGTPVSKQNQVPWNYIDYATSKTNAESMYSTSYVQSGLLTGTMWDTTMKWLQNAGVDVESSAGWGNYYESEVTGITSYSTDNGASWTDASTKPSRRGYLLRTGNSDYTKRKNIYDLAGNLFQWTSEIYSYDKVYRGCDFGSNFGNIGGADERNWSNRKDGSTSPCYFIGFRVGLFVVGD